jgi:hypothetical protein
MHVQPEAFNQPWHPDFVASACERFNTSSGETYIDVEKPMYDIQIWRNLYGETHI